MKLEETRELWPEESARTGTPVVCYVHVDPMQWRHLSFFNNVWVSVSIGVSDHLGNVPVVYDKFQVIKNVVEAFDLVRKPESRADAGKRTRLVRTRWMWLKNRVNWTEKKS